jgi:hypothetical protein
MDWVPDNPLLPDGEKWVLETFKDDPPRATRSLESLAGDMAQRQASTRLTRSNPTPEQQFAAIDGCIERLATLIQALEQDDVEGAARAENGFAEWHRSCYTKLTVQIYDAMRRPIRANPVRGAKSRLEELREAHARLMQYRIDMQAGKVRVRPKFRGNQVNMDALARLERLFRSSFGDAWEPTAWESDDKSSGRSYKLKAHNYPPFVIAIRHLLNAAGYRRNASARGWACEYIKQRKQSGKKSA